MSPNEHITLLSRQYYISNCTPKYLKGEENTLEFHSAEGGGALRDSSDLWQTAVSRVVWQQVASGAEVLMAHWQVLFSRVRRWVQRVLEVGVVQLPQLLGKTNKG